MPTWLLLIVMSLATYRLTRLITKDDFPPVLWMRDRLVGGWRPVTDAERLAYGADPLLGKPFRVADVDHGNGKVMSRWVVRWKWVPNWLADLLSCPWCASGWVSLGITTGVAFHPGVPAPVLTWWSVWGAGALLASREWA